MAMENHHLRKNKKAGPSVYDQNILVAKSMSKPQKNDNEEKNDNIHGIW